ncbi:unnamed protein product [Laminaria digitata]
MLPLLLPPAPPPQLDRWNEVTGHWTYQLYNTQQNYDYMPQQMMQNSNLMYQQQQQQQQYGGMATSPQYLQQQSWLGSPSARESQGMFSGGAAAWGWQQGGSYDHEEEDEDEEEEEVSKGVWDKYYTYRNGGRQPLWIHSATGIRTTVDPTA